MQLKHSNIVETFEYGLTTEDEPYLVMEFLDGATLHSTLVAYDPILDGRRVKFIREAAEAVAAVHEAGFIHPTFAQELHAHQWRRRHKTDRLRPDRACHQGIHAARQSHGNAQLHGAGVGPTPGTDRRLDVFAFGVTAYEICTFELPWMRGTTGMAAMTHDRPPTRSANTAPRSIRRWPRPYIHASSRCRKNAARRWRSSCN